MENFNPKKPMERRERERHNRPIIEIYSSQKCRFVSHCWRICWKIFVCREAHLYSLGTDRIENFRENLRAFFLYKHHWSKCALMLIFLTDLFWFSHTIQLGQKYFSNLILNAAHLKVNRVIDVKTNLDASKPPNAHKSGAYEKKPGHNATNWEITEENRRE